MGPIGIIMVPTFDIRHYSGLPLSSTLNGSCTNVCPVKINIHEQIVRSPLGVAETGSVLLSEELDPPEIVENLHSAYAHPRFREKAYTLLISGPSGSADIDGITCPSGRGHDDANCYILAAHENGTAQTILSPL